MANSGCKMLRRVRGAQDRKLCRSLTSRGAWRVAVCEEELVQPVLNGSGLPRAPLVSQLAYQVLLYRLDEPLCCPIRSRMVRRCLDVLHSIGSEENCKFVRHKLRTIICHNLFGRPKRCKNGAKLFYSLRRRGRFHVYNVDPIRMGIDKHQKPVLFVVCKV